MMLSQKLPGHTCPIFFALMSHPIHYDPLLTPVFLWLQTERKSSKGSMLSLLLALSLGIHSLTLYVILKQIPLTLYVILKQIPSSKLREKPHDSVQPINETRRNCLCFSCTSDFFFVNPACDVHMHVSEWGGMGWGGCSVCIVCVWYDAIVVLYHFIVIIHTFGCWHFSIGKVH